MSVSRKGNFCSANECRQEIDIHSAYYVCEKCNYYLHYLCAEPSFQQFNYLFHGHPLILQLGKYYRPISCILCRVPYERKDCYSCKTCHVNLHIDCALKTPTITFESKQNVDGGQHLCHNKEMELVEIKHGQGEVDKYSCRICELPLLSSSRTTPHQAYSCRICKNFFHRYCIESSPEITHPFHSSHSLKVTFFTHKNTGGGKCRSCCKTYPNCLFFYCGPCKIYICAGCIFSKVPPPFKYQGHDHLLHLIEKIPDDTKDVDCAAARAYCKQMVAANEFTNLQRYVFRCIDCKFDLHFLCGPLPCSISHCFHIHPLVLFDRIVEDDSGEHYCDVCESQRDPRICVYYCAKCKYVAHVNCVITEVVRVLKEDSRDLNKLRILGQRKLVISTEHNDDIAVGEDDDQIIQEHEPTQMALSDLIFSLDKQELQKLESDKVELDKGYISGPTEEKNKKNEKNERKVLESKISSVMTLILERENLWHAITIGPGPQESTIQLQDQEFSHYTYEMLVNKLKKCRDTSWWTNLTFHELKLKMVNVGGYMITWNLVPVMKHLLAKYGDISPRELLRLRRSRRSFYSPYIDELSWEMKSLVYFLICRLLNSMSETLVVHITEPLLANWYSCLQFVEYKGFEFGFIKSRLEEVTRAYFGLRKDAKTRLREKIANLEADLKRYKELLQGYEEDGGTKFELVEEYSEDASRLKWSTAAHGLF